MSNDLPFHLAEASLPTLTKLGNPAIPPNLDANELAAKWFSSFSAFAEAGDVDGVLSLLISSEFTSGFYGSGDTTIANPNPHALSVYWRDILALTWDIRTFEGISTIHQFLKDRLAISKLSNLKLTKGPPLALRQPFPDLAWIQLMFSFETEVGKGTGIARIVPLVGEDKAIVWKAHTVFTNLDDLKGFPEKIGRLRNQEPNHGKWEQQRKEETAFEGRDPTVLIIGGGHSGLNVAARLKALGVSNLIIERNPRLGDSWRTRYEALCLHDVVWYDHLPYIPFPPTWPVYSPAKKLANWLEQYAESLELNVWTSSTALSVRQDPKSKIWSVKVKQADGKERTFKVKHVVVTIGFKGGEPYIPSYPGMDTFKGQIVHSIGHKKAADHAGKKVVVIGSCTSAHDICADYADHGVDVTMFQRGSTYVMSVKNGMPILMSGLYEEGGPPTEVADVLNASFPNLLMTGISYRATGLIAGADSELLDGLHKRGFRTNMGYKDAGLLAMVYTKAGGYYMDVGGSQYIIDGRVKFKNDSQIKEFTANGILFGNGSEISADVVMFCTGLNDPRHAFRKLINEEEEGKKIPQIWDLNEEGELNGCVTELGGFSGLWNLMGNLALCRFYSKHLALQIKAQEEGLFGTRYSRNSA